MSQQENCFANLYFFHYKRLTSLKISSRPPSPIKRRSSFLPSSSPALSAASTRCLLRSLRNGIPFGMVHVGEELYQLKQGSIQSLKSLSVPSFSCSYIIDTISKTNLDPDIPSCKSIHRLLRSMWFWTAAMDAGDNISKSSPQIWRKLGHWSTMNNIVSKFTLNGMSQFNPIFRYIILLYPVKILQTTSNFSYYHTSHWKHCIDSSSLSLPSLASRSIIASNAPPLPTPPFRPMIAGPPISGKALPSWRLTRDRHLLKQ